MYKTSICDTIGLQNFIKDNNIQFHKPTILERLFI